MRRVAKAHCCKNSVAYSVRYTLYYKAGGIPMVERLQRAVQILETLPLNVQESVAEQLEQITASYASTQNVRRSHAGIWADLPDDMEETLDRWRHQVPPTPPIDEEVG